MRSVVHARSIRGIAAGETGEAVPVAPPGLSRRRPEARLRLGRRLRRCDAVAQDHPEVSGLFNLGTGQARSFADLVRGAVRRRRQAVEDHLCGHAARDPRPLPVLHPGRDGAAARGRLRPSPSPPLEEGVARYVQRLSRRRRSVFVMGKRPSMHRHADRSNRALGARLRSGGIVRRRLRSLQCAPAPRGADASVGMTLRAVGMTVRRLRRRCTDDDGINRCLIYS